MDELVTLVIQHRVGLGVEFGFKQPMTHLTRNPPDVVVMVSKAKMDRHLETVCDDLRVVETCRILEVEVVIRRRVIMKVIADQENLLDSRMK